MAAKLREKDGFYWVVVHHQGRRKWKKIGKDKRQALKVVHEVNAKLALGQFEEVAEVQDCLVFERQSVDGGEHLRRLVGGFH